MPVVTADGPQNNRPPLTHQNDIIAVMDLAKSMASAEPSECRNQERGSSCMNPPSFGAPIRASTQLSSAAELLSEERRSMIKRRSQSMIY